MGYAERLWRVRDRFQQAASKIIHGLLAPVIPVGVILLIILTAVLLSFLAADLAARGGVEPPRWSRLLTYPVLRLFQIDPEKLTDDVYARVIAIALSGFLALIAIWYSFMPVLAYFKHRSALEKASVVEIHPVRPGSKDDLQTMYNYYHKGTFITVFSGDFDWILKHTELRNLIVRLAGQQKILLVSYKQQGEIEQGWKDTAQELDMAEPYQKTLAQLHSRFRFPEEKRKFKFTLIEIGSDQHSFLSLVPAFPGTGKERDTNIGVHSGKSAHALAIVKVVREFCDPTVLDKLPGWNHEQPKPQSTDNV
ncbi:MAG: hypothetical protein IH830_01890 [Planctomycetes bacterium]|nr:hypothetical protein [Planctomycetota bacterium]